MIGLTYSGIMFFLWALMLMMAVVRMLRQARIEREEVLRARAIANPAAVRRVLEYVHSPLDDMREWNNSRQHPVAASATEIVPGPVVLPLRYRQTLLYGDEISDPPSR